MLEPPSERLTSQLRDLNLIDDKDLHRVRPHVARFCRDLPSFDSVWLDALVNARKITAYQADRLLREPESLTVGNYVLRESIGRNPRRDGFEAVSPEGRLVHLKRIPLPDDPQETIVNETIANGFEGLMQGCGDLRAEQIIRPETAFGSGGELVVVSPYVPGEDLRQHLIRCGRVSPAFAQSVATQLIDTLADLERVGLLHGAVRLEHLRVTPEGKLRVVEVGIEPILAPRITLEPGTRLESYSGIAPERIGTGAVSTPQSEMYSLGWLLWHLLAGRPPLVTGDPLKLLSFQQTRSLPPLRDWAPETPEPLEQLISSLTRFDPAQRPRSFEALKPNQAPARSPLRRRPATVPVAAHPTIPDPRVQPGPGRRGFSVVATVALLIAGVLGFYRTQPTASEPNPVAAETAESATSPVAPTGHLDDSTNTRTAEVDRAAVIGSRETPRPLPEPNERGEVRLIGGETYIASDIAFRGNLTIGSRSGSATVLVRTSTWRLRAESISLSGIVLTSETAKADATAKPLRTSLVIESQSLSVSHCRFESPTTRGSRIALAWRALDPADRSGQQIRFDDVFLTGSATGCYMQTPPDRLTISNVLKVGSGPLLRFAQPPRPGRLVRIGLQRTTLRDSGPLLRWTPIAKNPRVRGLGKIDLEATGCVFHLEHEQTPLIEYLSGSVPDAAMEALSIVGDETLVSAPLTVASFRPDLTKRAYPLPETALAVEGLVAGPFEFIGPADDDRGNSVLKHFQLPLRSATAPGIGRVIR